MELYLSEDSKKVIRDILKSKDKDGNGVLDARELGDCLSLVGLSPEPDDLQFLIKQFDANGDNELQIQELMENLDVVIAHSVNGPQLLAAFQKFESKKKGFIRQDDLLKVLTESSPHQMSPEDAKKQIKLLLDKYDENKDGKFSYPGERIFKLKKYLTIMEWTTKCLIDKYSCLIKEKLR